MCVRDVFRTHGGGMAGLGGAKDGHSPYAYANTHAHLHRTLDLEHTGVLKRLGRDRCHAEALRVEADALTARIEGIERTPRCERTDADYDEIKRCRYRLDSVVDAAEEAERRGDEVGYYIRTAGILFKYYDIIEKGSTMAGNAAVPHHPQRATAAATAADEADSAQQSQKPAQQQQQQSKCEARGDRSILSYFSGGGRGVQAAQQQAAQQAPQQQQAPSHVVSDDRATLFDRYLQSVEGEGPVCYAPEPDGCAGGAGGGDGHDTSRGGGGGGGGCGMGNAGRASNACGHCGGKVRTVQMQEGYVFCNTCHTIEYILVDHEKPSYKDPPKEVAYFAYKRINHFNEWLNQVQGKETTEISEDVYDSILLEIKKQKLTNMATLTRKKVKDILKKLRINKYYEHVPHIINRLNGMPSPHFPAELEDRLRQMFCQIQVPFLKHAPPQRKNFLSYSYCLNKMVQLLEKDQYLDSFPLLKSREKLHQQDVIWQKICAEIGWDFIPSL